MDISIDAYGTRRFFDKPKIEGNVYLDGERYSLYNSHMINTNKMRLEDFLSINYSGKNFDEMHFVDMRKKGEARFCRLFCPSI